MACMAEGLLGGDYKREVYDNTVRANDERAIWASANHIEDMVLQLPRLWERV